MTRQQQVIDANLVHPDWTARQIADHLGCSDAYVRAAAQRASLLLGRARQGNGSVYLTVGEIAERERSVDIVHRLCDPDLAKAITCEIRNIDALASIESAS